MTIKEQRWEFCHTTDLVQQTQRLQFPQKWIVLLGPSQVPPEVASISRSEARRSAGSGMARQRQPVPGRARQCPPESVSARQTRAQADVRLVCMEQLFYIFSVNSGTRPGSHLVDFISASATCQNGRQYPPGLTSAGQCRSASASDCPRLPVPARVRQGPWCPRRNDKQIRR